MKHIISQILLIISLVFYVHILCVFATSSVHHKDNFYQKARPLQESSGHSNVPAGNKNKKQTTISYKTEEKGDTAWSNAFNFKKIWGTQVDPRTGTLSAHIKAGSLLSNFGHGPNIDLELNYNSIATADPDGLGLGWRWNLTHFNPITNQLSTSFGQNFYLRQKNNSQWYPLYHKLHDIVISGDKDHHFVITYSNGLREILNHEGYEVSLEQQDGWHVHFTYIPGTHLLQSVTDDVGHYVFLRHEKNHVIVVSKGSAGQLVTVLINREKRVLRRIILPSENRYHHYDIRFTYMGHLITEVNYPTGLEEKFTYNCKDEMKLNIPGKFLGALCVVVHKAMDPGAAQPAMEKDYQYSKISNNEHNYLAFNAGLAISDFGKKDILFEAPVSYTYRTQEDDGLIREIRTYNKYHLLIDDQRVSDSTGEKISETHSFFCRTDKKDGCANSSFDDLPATYSQPLKVVTLLWGKASVSAAITTQMNRYDQQGRMIFHKDAYGRITKTDYCPVNGDRNCPATPDGWYFNTLTESVTMYPAITDTTTLPPIIIRNTYRKQFNRTGHGYILVLDHQVKQAGKLQITTKNSYYQNADNALTYGLLQQTIVTGNRNIQGPSRLHRVIRDYYYTQSGDGHSKTTYNATELSFGQKRLSPSVITSLFTNHPLQSSDPSGQNITRYHYDLWDRLVQTDFSVGTAFAVSNHYQYIISPTRNEILITATNGLQEKIIFDGAGRVIKRFHEMLTTEGKATPGRWTLANKTTYDKHGRIAAQFVYITDAEEKQNILTTTNEYDDLGRLTRIHLPDGETAVTQYDDVNRCVVSYRQGRQRNRSVISVTQANVLYKPIKQWVFSSNYKPVLSTEKLCAIKDREAISQNIKIYYMTYNGFGNIVTSTDPLGHITKKQYDELGRLTDTVDPVGDKVHNIYDLTGHVIQRWAQPASGGNYLLSSAEYNAAGELLWQAGEDQLHTVFTYNTDGKLSTTTTPGGHTIALKYNILGLPVTKLLDGKPQLQTTYNPVTLLVNEQTDITGKTHFIYGDDGLIQSLTHSGSSSYKNYTLRWKYDENRRIVSFTDIGANQTQTLYNTLGRISALRYKPGHGKTESLFVPVYDDLSRVIAIHYGSGMQRDIHYDVFGSQSYVADTLNGKILSSWSFNYDANGNITTLVNKTESKEQAILRYQYDALNNLVSMTCDGSSSLPLCPRDTDISKSYLQQAPIITRQDYRFTPLNQLASVREILQSHTQHQTLSKLITYQYVDNSAPLRLQHVSTRWNDQSSKTQNLSYDVMGNMTMDGEGNHILYNAFNQVIQVSKLDGQRSYYTYDGTGKEIEEKNSVGSRYLFYRGNALINEQIKSPGNVTHIKGYQEVAETMDGVIHQYNESNYKGDVVGIIARSSANSNDYKLSQRNIYSPYGMRWHSDIDPYQQTLLGFDGERTDPATGWQFLGAGHRTYNPKQRYFVSEDPAGSGYGFGSNNPIMNSDPSGNMPQWLGAAFRWTGYLSSFGLTALHKKWANIASAVITSGLTIATLGASAYACGGALAGSVTTAGATAAGAVPVIAAAIPANKGLNIAASVVGITEMAAMAATAAVDAGLFFTLKTSTILSNIAMRGVLFRMVNEEGSTNISYLFDCLSFLRSKVPRLISSSGKDNFLNIRNFAELNLVWRNLRSMNNNLIECDSACILSMANIVKKPLDLECFQYFLQVRYNYSILREKPTNPETFAEASVYYLSTEFSVMELLSDTQVISLKKSKLSLAQVLQKAGDIGVVMTPVHSQVVMRVTQEIWATYVIGNSQIAFRLAMSGDIDQMLFGRFRPEDRQIIAYMPLQLPSV